MVRVNKETTNSLFYTPLKYKKNLRKIIIVSKVIIEKNLTNLPSVPTAAPPEDHLIDLLHEGQAEQN